MTPEIGVLILGGGEATRLPGKLTLDAGQLPMIVRVFRNLSPGRTTYISCKATFAPEIDAELPCPMVVDRWPLRGPLSGLLSTMMEMETPLVFAAAGDAPLLDTAFIERLAARWEPGIEAVVPIHRENEREQLEPLAAIYDRLAFVREGFACLREGQSALRLVIDRLATRFVTVDDPRVFTNVNTPADYTRLQRLLESRP